MKVYDNYEISPCTRTEEPDSPGKFYFKVCEPEEADVWTLYGHIDGEGVEAIGDFSTREAAAQVYSRITGEEFTMSYQADVRLRVMHAGPKLFDLLVSIIPYAELGAEQLDAITDSKNTELTAGQAWNVIREARAAVAEGRTA